MDCKKAAVLFEESTRMSVLQIECVHFPQTPPLFLWHLPFF